MAAGSNPDRWPLSHVPTIDRWLRFDPLTEAIHEDERGADRVRYLRTAILLGLLFYNLYNFSAFYLMPDIFWPSVALRVVGVTGLSLVLIYLLPRVGPGTREWLMVVGMVAAFVSPVTFFALTTAPLGLFTFGELDLTLVFGGLVLTLRFRHLVLFVAFALGLTIAAILTKPGLPEGLTAAFVLQIATASVFVGISNYVVEARRCREYIDTLRARARAHTAETETLQMERRSLTDALTGLPNRRALDQRLERAFAGAGDVAILIADIDHFKPLNDTLGHVEGDRCLRAIAAAFAEVAVRHDGFCARYGGEEFVFLINGLSQSEAGRIAAGLVRQVQDMAIPHPGRKDGLAVVTVSLGVALREAAQPRSVLQVMSEADDAMYLAKRRGRNRFEIAGDNGQRVVTL